MYCSHVACTNTHILWPISYEGGTHSLPHTSEGHRTPTNHLVRQVFVK